MQSKHTSSSNRPNRAAKQAKELPPTDLPIAFPIVLNVIKKFIRDPAITHGQTREIYSHYHPPIDAVQKTQKTVRKGIYETGISDFHKVIFTVPKTYFQKTKPRIIKYRDYKHFDNNVFKDELIMGLSSNKMQCDDLAQFTNISKLISGKKAPLKERYVRFNQAKIMNKNLQKEITNRSRLLNRYRKKKTVATRSAYKKPRSFCMKLLRKTKKEIYNNLNVKYITENNFFWKTVKLSLTCIDQNLGFIKFFNDCSFTIV